MCAVRPGLARPALDHRQGELLVEAGRTERLGPVALLVEEWTVLFADTTMILMLQRAMRRTS